VKRVATAYMQEERRQIGAKPRLKAEIGPFGVDCGLKSSQGVFLHCSCPAAGVLQLADGYVTSGSWTSPVLQPYLGNLSSVIPSCVSLWDYGRPYLLVRTGATVAAVLAAPWEEAAWQTPVALGAYFQLKIEFRDFSRSWAVETVAEADDYTAYGVESGQDAYLSLAVDGLFPGRLTEISLSGLVSLEEEAIIDCQHIVAQRPACFHDLQGMTHTLTVDNSRRQWLPGHRNFLMADGLWYGKELRLYSGLELPNGETAWLLQYVGRIKDIREISNSFTGRQQAKIVSSPALYEALQGLIGIPGADGERRPFMAGAYRVKAELVASQPPFLGGVSKTGAGSAQLVALGEPTNTQDLDFLVEAETTGEIATATFRWSVDGGASWERTGLASVTSSTPYRLQDGVLIYFVPGAGTDLVAGDAFRFTAYARASRYVVAGGPFLAFTNIYLNGAEIFAYEAHPDSGEIILKGPTGVVEVRLEKSATSNPVDIIREILELAGVGDRLDPVTFMAARQALADYQIGVRFEGVTAWQAIRAICSMCLIFFWIEGDRYYLEAYTG